MKKVSVKIMAVWLVLTACASQRRKNGRFLKAVSGAFVSAVSRF